MTNNSSPPSNIDFEEMLTMYYEMLRIRKTEERLVELYNSGAITSLVHLSTGQEAVAVGICLSLNDKDLIFSTHRCHAHYLAKGGDLNKMFAELAGRADGCVGGRGGSMHLLDQEAGVALSVPIVAGSIPIAVGAAMAIKMKSENKVVISFFGDGAVEEGVFWESINYAAVHQLPIVFVCENNLYATHSHISKRQPEEPDIASRVASFGIQASVVDGNDVMAVYREAKKMVSATRTGFGPMFIEAKTYRWKEHWGPGEDWHLGYRSKEEGDQWKSRCPIVNLKTALLAEGVIDEFFIQTEQSIDQEIDRAAEFAKRSSIPKED